MARVLVHEQAWADLEELGAFIAKDKPEAASQVVHQLRQARQKKNVPSPSANGSMPWSISCGSTEMARVKPCLPLAARLLPFGRGS